MVKRDPRNACCEAGPPPNILTAELNRFAALCPTLSLHHRALSTDVKGREHTVTYIVGLHFS